MERIFYNVDMAKAIRRLKPPVKGLIMDIKAMPNFIGVTVYEENIMEYSESEREAIMKYLLMVRDVIKSYGTPCELNGVKYVAGRKHF